MKTKTINLYQFSELSDEAKEKAISKWYETEDYPFLSYNLTDSLKALLESKGCSYDDIKLYYSLGHSQGDGVCFTGRITKDGKILELDHNYRYYFASSVTMVFYDEHGNEIDYNEELRDIYFFVCQQIEEQGYSELEYRMNNEEFEELCNANNFTFLDSGIMENE